MLWGIYSGDMYGLADWKRLDRNHRELIQEDKNENSIRRCHSWDTTFTAAKSMHGKPILINDFLNEILFNLYVRTALDRRFTTKSKVKQSDANGFVTVLKLITFHTWKAIFIYIITQVILAFWLVLAYDLLEDRCTIDVIIRDFAAAILKWRKVLRTIGVIFYLTGQKIKYKKVLPKHWTGSRSQKAKDKGVSFRKWYRNNF